MPRPENLEVSLFGLDQTALILLTDDGPRYSNQVGGTACMQSSTRGILMPITNDSPLDNLCQCSLSHKLSSLCNDTIVYDNEADKIDELLKEVFDYTIVVDRERLLDSMEA